MTEILHLTAPYLGALSLSLIAYLIAGSLRFKPRLTRGLENFRATAGNTQVVAARGEQIGNRIASRLPFSLSTWEDHLKWAQRGGYYTGWGIGRLVFTALLYTAAGSLVLLLNPAPVSVLVPLGAAAYPFIF